MNSNKNYYQIIALDIDGTLTNSRKEITCQTQQALFKAQEKGVKAVLASGRPYYGIKPIAEQLHLKQFGGYVLAFNGGQIISCKSSENIYQSTIPKNFVTRINHSIENIKGLALMTYKNNYILTETPENPYVSKEATINKMRVLQVDHFDQHIDFPVTKCLIAGDSEKLVEIEKMEKDIFKNMLSIYRSEPFFLEIMPKNIDKANSLSWLLNYLGLNKAQLIAFGDGLNDISMIKYAGLGVAMENAQLPVKKAADYITFSNEHNGIVHILKRLAIC